MLVSNLNRRSSHVHTNIRKIKKNISVSFCHTLAHISHNEKKQNGFINCIAINKTYALYKLKQTYCYPPTPVKHKELYRSHFCD